METSELALGSSGNTFVLEKVLQEVQEVEDREHRPEAEAAAPATATTTTTTTPAAAPGDLKFRPGFVHLLKDRFALLSLQAGERRRSSGEAVNAGESARAASGLDLANNGTARRSPAPHLGATRGLSRSTDHLDGPRVTNGWASPALPRDYLQDSLADGASRTQRSANFSPSGERFRAGGSKIVIIEASGAKVTSPQKKAPSPVAEPPTQKAPVEAWPSPNIVAATRTLFESAVTRHGRSPPPKQPPSPAKTPSPKKTPPPPRAGASKSVFLSGNNISVVRHPPKATAPRPEETAAAEPVVRVSEARRLFDRPGPVLQRQSSAELRSRTSPKRKAPAPDVTKAKERAPVPVKTAAVNGSSPSADPSTWKSWEDIPKPQRRSFVTEARRVEIPKEQLSASRAKSKSFFFTAADSTAAAIPAEPQDGLDRTVTIKVEAEAKAEPQEDQNSARLAERTFWDSYRKEEEEEEKATGPCDPELMEEYRRLMADARADARVDARVDARDGVDEPLPSTNIDDVPVTERSRPLAVTKSGQRAEERKRKKLKQRLQFAEPERLTTTHEYPSERALIEQLGISPDFDLDSAGELSIDDPSAFFGLDDPEETDEVSRSASRLLAGTSAVSAGSLASYKSKYSGDEFAWGATERSVGTVRVEAAPEPQPESPVMEAEAEPPDELTWSSAATADLLF